MFNSYFYTLLYKIKKPGTMAGVDVIIISDLSIIMKENVIKFDQTRKIV
jgi:hypothetical protein